MKTLIETATKSHEAAEINNLGVRGQAEIGCSGILKEL